MASTGSENSWGDVHFLRKTELEDFVASRPLDMAVFEADVSQLCDDKQVLAMLARVLSFPDYFSLNWDALDECLVDMEWAPARGYRLILAGSRKFWTNQPNLAGKLVSSWLVAAEDWGKKNVPFDLVFLP